MSKQKDKAKRVNLRLRPSQIKAAREIAVRKDVPYQTLIRSWVNEGILREKEKENGK